MSYLHIICTHVTIGRRTPVTIVATDDTLYIAKENFAHWPLPRIQALPEREALLPPFFDVEQKNMIDVESIVSLTIATQYAVNFHTHSYFYVLHRSLIGIN